MSDRPYSKREIDALLKSDGEKDATFKQDIREALTRIETQTSMTNGRVSRLERWQSYVVGFGAGISLILISVLIPLLGIAVGFIGA